MMSMSPSMNTKCVTSFGSAVAPTFRASPRRHAPPGDSWSTTETLKSKSTLASTSRPASLRHGLCHSIQQRACHLRTPGSASYRPRTAVLLRSADPAEHRRLASIAPFASGQGPINGEAAAYVCQDFACHRPTSDASEMLALLG